ncbi:MAG: hypothetical protein ACE5PO_01990 [Candidatus Bathyarchaeia archaeon]
MSFKCPDAEYVYLQRLRNRLITFKVNYRHFEEEAEAAKQFNRLDEAERLISVANSLVKGIRQTEEDIRELEKRCFGS